MRHQEAFGKSRPRWLNRLLTAAGALTFDRDRMLSYGNATYSYAPAGELAEKVVGGDTTRYAHHALGNLTSVELSGGDTISYEVDGVNEWGFHYRDQLDPVAELDGRGRVVARFVYGDRINVPD